MTYRLQIPGKKQSVLSILDTLVSERSVVISDVKLSRNVGMYLKPWRDLGFISLYVESEQKRTILTSNVDISKSVRRGNWMEFTVDESVLRSLLPKLPRL